MKFSRIGIIGKHSKHEVQQLAISLVAYLEQLGLTIIIESQLAGHIPPSTAQVDQLDSIAQHCDLIVLIGGDGSLLNAARAVVDHDVPVIGINCGRRGFLTDLSAQDFTHTLGPILEGQYKEERRFLLEMALWRNNQCVHEGIALNEVTLYSGHIARIMEFQVWINQQFVYRQRSDGIITATPTGSTAYALAGGGPILHPSLDAFVIVPMHPAVLSSRPIVVDSQSTVELHLVPENPLKPRISCDGQMHFDAHPDDRIFIRRKAKELRLLHPHDYDYYHTLRTKLGWSA